LSSRALTTQQEASLDLLVDVIELHGKPGPWPDREPAVPVETWRNKLTDPSPDHANARQMVRRTMRALITSGCVIEHDGLVAVGSFSMEIEVRK
jgi:hypothetical protein